MLLVVLALLGGGAVAWRTGWAEEAWDRLAALREAPAPDPVTEPAAVPPPPGLDVPEIPEPAPVAAAATGGRMQAGAVRRALAPLLDDPALGRSVHAAVADLGRPEAPAWTVGADGAFTPASTMKVVTAAAALAALGPDHRFTTRAVLRGSTLTLVGGGDPRLARVPDPEQPEVADLTTLARASATALAQRPGRPRPVRLAYDTTLFTGPTDNPAWRADYVTDDIVSPITALWVDEGLSPDRGFRVDDPAAEAAEVFADALRRAGATVRGTPRPAAASSGAKELAAVDSPPLDQVVERFLEVSDNETAEVLAHHVGAEVAGEASFAGAARGVRETLARLGVPLDGTQLLDGSGLARGNRLTPATLLGVLRAAGDPDRPELRAVLTGLPVAGFTGSLAFRFDTGPDAADGRVRAKTGSLTGIRSLAGVALDQTGTPLAFVLAADRIRYARTVDAEQALDEVAAALGACRCSR